MGIRACVCDRDDPYQGASALYYDDLPDGVHDNSVIHQDSMSRFKPHKIVSTFASTPTPPPQSNTPSKRTQRKSKRMRIRKSVREHRAYSDDTYTHSAFSNLTQYHTPISVNSAGFTSNLPAMNLEDIDCWNKRYVLYREGSITNSNGNTATKPLHTITTRTMKEMDINNHSNILKNSFYLNHLISRCPRRYHWMKWDLKYSILSDGCSINTLYRNIDRMERSLLIIRDDADHIFGAFIDCKIYSKNKDDDSSYRGSKESFVFRFEFEKKEYSIFEYHHTGTEPYILQCDSRNGITIGKGECPAIFIQNDLLKGSSMECDTFRNEVLCVDDHEFRIKDLEIWCPTMENSIISGGYTYYDELGYLGTPGSTGSSKKWGSTI